MHRRLILIVTVCAVVTSMVTAQQAGAPASNEPVFDVASIKLNTSGDRNTSLGARPGGYVATNAPLGMLVQQAFGFRPGQLVGVPAWAMSARFDVTARASDATSPNIVLQMLRTLLRDRFKLKVHTENREQPVYALVRSRTDGRLGPQLRPSKAECAPAAGQADPCRLSGSIGSVSGSVKATGQTMAQLARYLGANVDRPVVDRTGLEGRFDFELAWTADDLKATDAVAGAQTNERASLFAVLSDSLGLKLESSKGPVEFLVIDSAEQPTPD